MGQSYAFASANKELKKVFSPHSHKYRISQFIHFSMTGESVIDDEKNLDDDGKNIQGIDSKISTMMDSNALAKQIISSPWKMSKVANIGRELVATRDIKPWEKVVEDFALITVPTHRAVCLGCLGDVSGCVVCVRCKWPMCRQECQNAAPHQEECQIFQQSQIVPDIENLDKCQRL